MSAPVLPLIVPTPRSDDPEPNLARSAEVRMSKASPPVIAPLEIVPELRLRPPELMARLPVPLITPLKVEPE